MQQAVRVDALKIHTIQFFFTRTVRNIASTLCLDPSNLVYACFRNKAINMWLKHAINHEFDSPIHRLACPIFHCTSSCFKLHSWYCHHWKQIHKVCYRFLYTLYGKKPPSLSCIANIIKNEVDIRQHPWNWGLCNIYQGLSKSS